MANADPKTPVRYLAEEDFRRFVPVHVVWEITLACDLKCLHCGSRAGHRRASELTTGECLDVVRSLAALGTREVSLIGGEAYLRRDWTDIVRAVRSHGMYCAIQTGGRNLTPERMRSGIDAGLNGIGVSLDGMAPLHDRVRNVPRSFHKALDTLRRARDAGLAISVNTQIGAETMDDLPELMETIIEIGAKQWQIQLTVAMGNAVDNDGLLLQPYRLLELMPLLARLYREGVARGLLMVVGNNIGYFGPYEHLWRGFGDELIHWTGCRAGQNVIALEADGTVKGCPSLATVGFAGGNVRNLTLEDIWHNSPEIHFGRLRSVEDLWGFCRTCYYADVCRAGFTGPRTPCSARRATIRTVTIVLSNSTSWAYASAFEKSATPPRHPSPSANSRLSLNAWPMALSFRPARRSLGLGTTGVRPRLHARAVSRRDSICVDHAMAISSRTRRPVRTAVPTFTQPRPLTTTNAASVPC
jgi:Y-X(10)_GDL-associated radical SAM protein